MRKNIIKAVQPHMLLYDQNHSDYMNYILKQDVWKSIANDLQLSNGKYYENNLFRMQTM